MDEASGSTRPIERIATFGPERNVGRPAHPVFTVPSLEEIALRPWREATTDAKAGAMTEFVDLQGASGARYRFRRADLAALPAMAGNLVVASGAPGRLKVRFCGAARSLAQAAPAIAQALSAHRGARLYIRLNVARTTREAEHADLVAGLNPETQTGDLD